MQIGKKHISRPILIASAAAIAVLAVFGGVKIWASSASKDYIDPDGITWDDVAADPEKYGVDPDSLNDLYLGQTEGGVCTHDESFSEPQVPDGKYYPNGDSSADYYAEISGSTLCFRSSDGTPYETQNSQWYGEHEYRIITLHYDDTSMLCTAWEDYEKPEGSPLLDRYRIISGTQIDFDENGKAYIHPLALDDRMSEDMTNNVRLYIPEE